MKIRARHPDHGGSVPLVTSPEDGAMFVTCAADYAQHTGWAFKVTHQKDVTSQNICTLSWTVPYIAEHTHVHMKYTVLCEGEAEVAFYEDVKITANTGTAKVPICANRATPKVSALAAAYADATLNIVDATLLDVEVVGNGYQNGGRSNSLLNWTLCAGKSYALVVKNQTGQANEITIKLDCYRHTEVTE